MRRKRHGPVDGLRSASLVDAMGRVHRHRAHLGPLVSPTPGRVLFGPVVTMAFMPARDDLPESDLDFGRLFGHAVKDAEAGAVLVLSSGGYAEASHAGAVKLSRLQHHRMAGLLTDGRVRDFAELARFEFATWCGGEAIRWGGDCVMPFAANVAVEVGGVCVNPGDFAFADAAGAVIIPSGSLDRVLAEARAIDEDDARLLQQWGDKYAAEARGPDLGDG